jgi:AcrR family transcriptional regulator
MPRPAKFNETLILDATASIVAAHGLGAATITAIATALGAPNGSIYHRFQSRDELLGRLWLRTAAFFQDRFVAALEHPDARQAGLEAALSLPRSVRANPEGARIMLLHRREDFLSTGWPPAMTAEAERLGKQVRDNLAAMTRRLFGRNTRAAREATTFALLDIPFAAVRRHVAAGELASSQVDDLIAAAYAAVIDAQLATHRDAGLKERG